MTRAALESLLAKVEAGHLSTDDISAAFGNLWDDVLVLGAFDGSLDAAKALHDAVLPGWEWGKEALSGKVYVMEIDGNGIEFGEAYIPARAMLIAIIRAMLAEGE